MKTASINFPINSVAAGLLLACALLSGCVGPSYRVNVSGFNDPSITVGHTYWLLSAKENVSVEDLEFREYAVYVRSGLGRAGFSESASLDQADLAIFIGYGIGDTKEHAYSYSLPVYGQTGGGTYNFSATTYSGYGSATTYGTATQMPQYGVVGSQQISGTTVTHLRYLFVDALDMKPFRSENKKVSVWRTDVMSRGTSGDLRQMFPVLVAAATPHFGKNTKKQVVVDLNESDKRVQELRLEVDSDKKHNSK